MAAPTKEQTERARALGITTEKIDQPMMFHTTYYQRCEIQSFANRNGVKVSAALRYLINKGLEHESQTDN